MSSENFAKLYKNDGKPEDSRRRRTETSVELRKQKGNDEMMKRRNLTVDLDESCTSGSDTEESQQQQTLQQLTMKQAVALLKSNPTIEQIRNAFESVRRVLSRDSNPPIDEIIKLGFPVALVQALDIEDEKVKFEAAWAITNIVSGTSAQTWSVVNVGCIPPLLQMCAHPSIKLAEQAVWAIANIAGDGVKLRDMLFEAGIVPLFLQLVNHIEKLGKPFVRNLTWAISNLCRHRKPSSPHAILAQLAPAIAALLKYNDPATQTDACWALSYLTDGTDENLELALKANVIPDVVHFISSGQDSMIAPALRVLGNFATGSDELTQVVIDCGIFTGAVPQLMLSNNSTFVKECCWLISNVMAGNHQQIQDLIDAQLLPLLFQVLKDGEHKVQFEAGWAVANLAHSGTANQVLEICRVKNGIEAICGNLGVKNNELLVNMLDTLYSVLYTVSTHDPENLTKVCERVEESDGLDKLEALQQHGSEKIYQVAYKIIDEFFSDDDDELGEDDKPLMMKTMNNVKANNDDGVDQNSMAFNF